MSERTLQEQLKGICTQLFPGKQVSADEVRKIAVDLGKLVPNALARELRRYLQAYRVAPNEPERIEQEQRLAAILIELVSSKGDFLAQSAFSRVREELLELADRKDYSHAVEQFREQAKRRENEKRRLRHEKERWRRWVADIRGEFSAVSTIATAIERPLAALTDVDLRLCLAWANRTVNQNKSVRDHWTDFVRMDSNDALRLWSARSAEIVAVSFLTDLGKQTTDVSLGQLDRNSDNWRTHDVEADGEPFDVKNARRSFSSPDSYVEHTIPQFTCARRRTTDVTILGVLSDYVPWARIDAAQFGFATILGELRDEDLAKFSSWVNRYFGDIMDVSLISGYPLNTYPGWLFEYAEPWYSGRSEALKRISKLLKECPDPLRAQEVIPLYLNDFLRDSAQALATDGAKLDDDLFNQFTMLRRELGLSRRSLFGWILGVMLRALIGGGGISVQHTGTFLRKLLFVPNSPEIRTDPAGLFDPKSYVSNLITMFEEIARNIKPDLLRSMRFFKLTSPTILRGRLDDGRWQTVFAHCGGWRRHPTAAPCGNNPIHLGNSDICPHCGYLICSKCGHCLKTCSFCEERMNKWYEDQKKVG